MIGHNATTVDKVSTDFVDDNWDQLRRKNPQRALATDLVNTVGVKRALEFARERQWFGVMDHIRHLWPADPAL